MLYWQPKFCKKSLIFAQIEKDHFHSLLLYLYLYKACPSESGTEVGAQLFPAVELCDFSGIWQCMSGEIWYTLDSGSVLLTETEAR